VGQSLICGNHISRRELVLQRLSAKARNDMSLKESAEEVKAKPDFDLSFAKDHKTAFAIIHALEIIAELTKRIPQSMREGYQKFLCGK